MIHAIAPNLWTVDGEDVRMPGGVCFQVRSTVVRLGSGDLLVISPVRFSPAIADAIRALGPVRWLVSPCLMHHLFLGEARQHFPDARIVAPRGLKKKRPDLTIDATLAEAAAAWASDLETLRIEGVPAIDEHVFYHPSSRTLIVTDLLFHQLSPPNFMTRLVMRMVGAYRRLAQSRLWRMATRDRAAAGASVERMLAWPFDRLIMAHGTIIDTDAHARTTAALYWMRAGVRALPG